MEKFLSKKTKARVREIGRLLVELKRVARQKNATLEDCLPNKQLKKVINAVRAVVEFNHDTMIYEHPFVAIKLVHTICKCFQILKGQGIESLKIV